LGRDRPGRWVGGKFVGWWDEPSAYCEDDDEPIDYAPNYPTAEIVVEQPAVDRRVLTVIEEGEDRSGVMTLSGSRSSGAGTFTESTVMLVTAS
jgi:hypothetical protein